jgi:2-polyprenyl-3-methyl-5-hydroxy-6-metoxy-1,4-benzoquinol methylase
MAAALGATLQVQKWPVAAAFLKYNRVKEFYGTGNKNMPYQSLFLNGEEVIVGRRRDLKDRLNLVPAEVIIGKDVLDVACSVGMSALLARAMGARSCLGLEYSAEMVDIANRFAMFSDAYPAVSYRHFNIDTDRLPADRVFDTAFMFSIHDHLKEPAKLAQLADHHVRNAVVFEAHPGGKAKEYAGFLESGLFASVTEIGRLDTSSTQKDQGRTLWLCLKPAN